MIVIFSLLILFIYGCDTGIDKSVTGAFFYRNLGDFKTVVVSPDSISMGNNFRGDIGLYPYTLAGKYENISAASVFSFTISDIPSDSLAGASLECDIRNLWNDGAIEFALYKTHSDWSDTTTLDPDLFQPGPNDLLSIFSSESTDLLTLTFDIDSAFFEGVSNDISFLVKNTDTGAAMVSLLSNETLTPPILYLHRILASGEIDTTGVYCYKDTYYFQTGHDEDEHLLSEGVASGFVLKIGLPETIPPLASINRCILKLNAHDLVIAEEPMQVSINKLTNEFATIDSVEIDTTENIYLEIYSQEEIYELDITSFVNNWHVGGESHFGLLFKPTGDDVSPNQCVFSTGDSLVITYTGLPEVE